MIRDSDRPYSTAALADDLRRLGVTAGATVLAHVSLSRLGFVSGGAVAVLDALLSVIGPEGTLVMAAQSTDLTDPASWRHPAVPPGWIAAIQRDMTPYDPVRTPSTGLGVVAELFRTWPGVGRSAHPVCSFAAFGPAAAAILTPHGLDDPFGETSPLARLYASHAYILLLGAPWSSCTALHLAERRADPTAAPIPNYSPILVDGQRRMASWLEYPHESDNFPPVGKAVEEKGIVATGLVGQATSHYVRLSTAVDFATPLLARRSAG